jgi:hypothetical protein
MARLIPKIDPEDIQEPGERTVARALVAQLPDDCVIYHGLRWLRPEQSRQADKLYLQPGEVDFIVVHPDHGVLVLEVKGGPLEYDEKRERWGRREEGKTRLKQVKEDPFTQAERNQHSVRDELKKYGLFGHKHEPLPFTLGHAVVFPHSRYRGTLPANAQPDILITADDLDRLAERIPEALDAWRRGARVPLGRPELDAIQESLSPMLHLTPVLWRTLDDQEARLKRLTDEQERLLDLLSTLERAAIQGVAGSGKTILALSQAQRFARAGKRTLLVCYNLPLAEWLRGQIPEKYRGRIDVQTFHGLCSKMCKLAGVPFPTTDRRDFWTYEAPELLEAACKIAADQHGYDAIVADEGQDFEDNWWHALQQTFRTAEQRVDPGKMVLFVFYDPRQNIYVEHPAVPAALGRSFPLARNCRNTRRISALCGQILGSPLETYDGTPEGDEPRQSTYGSPHTTLKHTQRVLEDWCLRDRGGLALNRVAILTARDVSSDWPDTLGSIPLTRSFDDWRAGKGVLLTTHRRFKGLEADGLVLAGIPQPGKDDFYSVADHYVACSRAKHLLEIVFDDSQT